MSARDSTGSLANVHQVNVTYVAEEDRIVTRVALETSEVCFWITRRCLSLFWPLLTDRLSRTASVVMQTDSEAKAMVLEYEHLRSIRSSDLSSPYVYQDSSMPIPACEQDDANRTVEGVRGFVIAQISVPNVSAQDSWEVTFLPMEGSGVTLNMPLDFWHTFSHMLIQASESAQWQLGLVLQGVSPLAPSESKHINRVFH